MSKGYEDMRLTAATVALAGILWFATFYLAAGVFWYKIAASAFILAGLSFVLQPARQFGFSFSLRSIWLGLASAAILYLIFWAGKAVCTTVFPFAEQQVAGIYQQGQGTSIWVIVLLIFFVTSPCEELYWRGFLQRKLMQRFGGFRGWLLAALLYAGVHIFSGNFILIGAAGVAGFFWGFMYWRLGDISVLIISHAVWSTFIFAVQPIP
ncbi:MAG: CPBP family intramembrane glutamic endopeptidase [Desulfohalobiaceae bacterium]